MAKIAHHLALGPLAQLLRIAIERALVQAVDEQAWMLDHAFALLTLRALVVVEPGAQLARAQHVRVQAREQPVRVIAVGARQRSEDARGRPTRHARASHRLQQGLRQCAEQHQAPLHPAYVACALMGRVTPLQTMGIDQFAQQQRLLDGRELARTRACEHLCQRLVHRAAPALNLRRVATQPRERGHAPVAVNEHQASVFGIARGNAFHQLPALLDRVGQPLHG